MSEDKTNGEPRSEKKIMRCEDIQPLLFDYMSRELGEGRAAIVREHLRKCKTCQVVAKDIQATLDLLHTASKAEPKQTERLTDKRRKKIVWAFTHPVMSWMAKHMFFISVIAAIITIISVAAFMRFMLEKHFAPIKGKPITVIIVNRGQTNMIQETSNIQSEVQQRP
ncbi:MAG: zf-HC2 domain-containing protein [Kiritimatiellae bacterium]|nr:zf-HC2 domain-containing protein [Kiritimatiellia bacterium]MDD5519179.1 zf-HC2 domain-containing protein [Kiritimatiellia bacterium]